MINRVITISREAARGIRIVGKEVTAKLVDGEASFPVTVFLFSFC